MTRDEIPLTRTTDIDPVFDSDAAFLAWWRQEEKRVRQQAALGQEPEVTR